MELQQLHYFMITAKYEHITHAAEALHIAQPALSQSIKRLEEELGVPLFERKNRSIRLNEAGRLLEHRLTPLLSTLTHLPAELRAVQEAPGKTIRLNILAASTVMTSRIIAYRALHPDVEFILTQSTNAEDCELTVSSAQIGKHSQLSELLYEEEFYLAVPAVSRYARLTSIRLEEVAHEGFLFLSDTKPIRALYEHFCIMAGFTPRILFESDNLDALRNMVSAGFGIALWPQHSWAFLKNSHIILLPITAPICKRDIIVTRTSSSVANPAADDFYQFLIHTGCDLI